MSVLELDIYRKIVHMYDVCAKPIEPKVKSANISTANYRRRRNEHSNCYERIASL